MDNKKLLNRYKIKLSLFFAVFVMLCFIIIEGFFLGIQYFNQKTQTQELLLKKLIGVENILNNGDKYFSAVQDNQTIEKLLYKTLNNTIIYKNGEIILNYLENDSIIKNNFVGFKDIKNYKVLSSYSGEYNIILITSFDYNLNFYLKILLYFAIFSFPFFIIFYLLGYFIIGKYFKVINESIESLENFTSNINHELKTPISEIISTLSLAKEINNYKDAVEISLDSTLKLNKILNSIIGIANISNLSYKKQRLDLVNLTNNLIKEYSQKANDKNLNIIFYPDKKTIYRKINRDHFEICVKNIISNAIKYSNFNSNIEIYLNNNEISIKDYGIGIDTKNLKNIFKRYFRENYLENEGFGIGLNLVKKICDLNNWKIEIDSEKNKYTNFKINFN